MGMDFYSVKHRRTVSVPEGDVKKKRFNKDGGPKERYGAVADVTVDGARVKLTKFISRETFNTLPVPEVD